MAVLRPSLHALEQLTRPLNDSERAVAQVLDRLDDNWTVYIQPKVAFEQPSFVLVHEYLGVCLMEIRDWAPTDTAPADDHPCSDASRARSVLYDQFFALPSDSTEPSQVVRAVVILPRCTNADARRLVGTTLIDGVVPGVEVWGGEGLRDEPARIVQGTGCAHPRRESIDRVHSHVVASETPPRPAPAPRSAGVVEIETNKSGGQFRRVRGAAGSGKSFGLTARAAHLAAQGKQVLVLSFSVTFANHLRHLIAQRCLEYGANPTRVTCANFHSLCAHVVQDAAARGFESEGLPRARWTQSIVKKATDVIERTEVPRYDAILVDEGQDYERDWWNLLRNGLLAPGGEMLLTVDPTQDLYGRTGWHTDQEMAAAGFDGPWLELDGCYRQPTDFDSHMTQFAEGRLEGRSLPTTVPGDVAEVRGPSHGSLRLWRSVPRIGDIGVSVGREVIRLLRQHPALRPADVSFVCEYHHDGVAAVREIESAGYEVHHIFSRDPDDARRRRKYRFDPEAPAITGSTVHNVKGWQATALVVGIGMETMSTRMAYVAMTRLKSHPERPAVISVISADARLNEFGATFTGTPAPQPESLRTAAPVTTNQPTPAPAPVPAPAPAPGPTLQPTQPLTAPTTPDGGAALAPPPTSMPASSGASTPAPAAPIAMPLAAPTAPGTTHERPIPPMTLQSPPSPPPPAAPNAPSAPLAAANGFDAPPTHAPLHDQSPLPPPPPPASMPLSPPEVAWSEPQRT